jgi:hypothetical protein
MPVILRILTLGMLKHALSIELYPLNHPLPVTPETGNRDFQWSKS